MRSQLIPDWQGHADSWAEGTKLAGMVNSQWQRKEYIHKHDYLGKEVKE